MSSDPYVPSGTRVTVDSLWGNKRRRSSKHGLPKGRGLRAGTTLSPEIAEQLGIAEAHYIAGEYGEAIKVLSETAKLAPKLSYIYSMLALIYEESGYPSFALQLYALAAAYHSRDLDSWQKVAHVGIEQREYDQALTALYRCCKLSFSKFQKAQKSQADKIKQGELEEEDETDNGEDTKNDDIMSSSGRGFEALSARNKFKHNDSDYQQYSKLRMLLLIKTGKFATFRDGIKAYRQVFPDDVRIFCDLGQSFFEEGYDRFAVEYFQKFLEHFLLTLIQQNYHLSVMQQNPSGNSTSSFLAAKSFNLSATRVALEHLGSNIFDVFFATRQLCILLLEAFNESSEVVELIENLFTIFHQMKSFDPAIVGVQDVEFPIDLLLMLGLNKLKVARIDVEVDSAIKILQPALTSIMANPQNFFTIESNHSGMNVEGEEENLFVDQRILEDQLFVLYELVLIAEASSDHGMKTKGQKIVAFVADIMHRLITNQTVYDTFVLILSGGLSTSAESLGDSSRAASTTSICDQVSYRVVKNVLARLLASPMFSAVPTKPAVESIVNIIRHSSNNDPSDAQLLHHYATAVIGRYAPCDFSFQDMLQKLKFFDELSCHFFSVLAQRSLNSQRKEGPMIVDKDGESEKEKFNEEEKDEDVAEELDQVIVHPMHNEAAIPVIDDGEDEEDEEVGEKELDQVFQHALTPSDGDNAVIRDGNGQISAVSNMSFLADDEGSSDTIENQELDEKLKKTVFTQLQGRSFVSRYLVKDILLTFHQYTLALLNKMRFQLKSLISTGANAAAAMREYNKEVSTFLTLVFAWFDCYQRIPMLRLKTRERIELESVSLHMKKCCDKLIALSLLPSHGPTQTSADVQQVDPTIQATFERMDVEGILHSDSESRKYEGYHWMRRKDKELYSVVVILCEYFPVEEFVTKDILVSYGEKAGEILREYSMDNEANMLEDIGKYIATMKLNELPGTSGTGGSSGGVPLHYSTATVAASGPSPTTQPSRLLSSISTNQTSASGKGYWQVDQSKPVTTTLMMNSILEKSNQIKSRRLNRLFYHQRRFINSAEQINEECKNIAETLTIQYNDMCKIVYEMRKASGKGKNLTNTSIGGTISEQTPSDYQLENNVKQLEKEMIYQTNLFIQLLHQQFHAGGSDENNIDTSSVLNISTSKYIENRLPIRSIFSENQLRDVKTVTIELLLGHEWAIYKRHSEVVDHYLNAYILDPNQPLTSLCLATYLLMLANHQMTKHRHDVVNKAFAFFLHYQHLRTTQPSPALGTNEHFTIISEAARRQEAFFNFGRAFHELDLFHLAMNQYEQALSLVDEFPDLLDVSDNELRLNVTRQAAFNLSLLYKKSKAPELALELMTKYLMFD